MIKLMNLASTLRSNKDGATAIEYGLIAALIAVAIIGAITLLGTDLGNTFNNVGNSLAG
jgi:pilus assembly protein Flp/PilA